jgi:hypothetical protein
MEPSRLPPGESTALHPVVDTSALVARAVFDLP